MGAQDALTVKAVMFVARGFEPLVDGSYAKSDQMHAAIDLMQFANAYVLNDCTIIGGNVFADRFNERGGDYLSAFINASVDSSQGLSIISDASGLKPDVPKPAYDIGPCLAAVDLRQREEAFDALSTQADAASKAYERRSRIEEYAALEARYRDLALRVQLERSLLNQRLMHAYMMKSDELSADFVPEYYFGLDALKTYPAFLAEQAVTVRRKRSHPHFDRFVDETIDLLANPVERNGVETLRQPNFLIEALRQTDNVARLGTTLRELRESRAATTYRDLNRQRLFAPRGEDRANADNEIRAGVDERFRREGFSSRVSSKARVAVGLTGIGLSLLFPGVGVLGDLLSTAMDAADWIDKVVRRRRSPFVMLFKQSERNAYQELRAKFPAIRFDEHEFAETLASRQTTLSALLRS